MSIQAVLEGTDPDDVQLLDRTNIKKGSKAHHCASCEAEVRERKTKLLLLLAEKPGSGGATKQMFVCAQCMAQPGELLARVLQAVGSRPNKDLVDAQRRGAIKYAGSPCRVPAHVSADGNTERYTLNNQCMQCRYARNDDP